MNYICERKGIQPIQNVLEDFWVHRENELEKLAKTVRENIDMEEFYAILHES